MEGILTFFGIIAAFCLGAWHLVGYEFRKADEEEKLEKLKLDLKLVEEKKKPKVRIEFELPSGAIERTEPIEPEVIIIGRRFTYGKIFTSKQVADTKLKLFYELGHFVDESGMTYPACNVMKAYIKEEI
jgi:hypothetical protein